MIGFKLTNSLANDFDIEVRETIAVPFSAIHPFLRKNDLTIENIDHLIFHPGGKNRADS
jgi:predicted naringenin-chalcone synthase